MKSNLTNKVIIGWIAFFLTKTKKTFPTFRAIPMLHRNKTASSVFNLKKKGRMVYFIKEYMKGEK